MANGNDHRLAREADVRQRDGGRHHAAAGHDRPPGGRRILDIVLWSSLTNLMLLACFLVGWNFDEIRSRVLDTAESAEAVAADQQAVATAQLGLEDNELLTKGPQRQLKGPLQITVMPATQAEPPAQASADPPAEMLPETVAAADGAVPEQDQGDGSGDITLGPEDPSAQLARSPVLTKGKNSGDVAIGSFATVSLPGSSGECLDTAYGLLQDAGAGRDKLRVLADSKMITIARICADNGSLVVTCRMDQITISPRRLKPNETCTG